MEFPVRALACRLALGDSGTHHRQPGLRLLDRHAAREAREREVLVVVATQHVGVGLTARTERLEDLALARPCRIRLSDADDGGGGAPAPASPAHPPPVAPPPPDPETAPANAHRRRRRQRLPAGAETAC